MKSLTEFERDLHCGHISTDEIIRRLHEAEGEVEYLRKGLKVLVDKAEDPDAAQFADKLLHREVVL